MAALEEPLNKMNIEKVDYGSPVLKGLSLESLKWIFAKTLAEFIQFGQDPRRENLVFHWRKISFTYTYIYTYIYIWINEEKSIY